MFVSTQIKELLARYQPIRWYSDNVILLGSIPKNEQLLDRPFNRLLLESLYIKTSYYLQVKDHGFWTEQLLILSSKC